MLQNGYNICARDLPDIYIYIYIYIYISSAASYFGYMYTCQAYPCAYLQLLHMQ